MACECGDGARAPNPGMQDVWVDPIHFLWRTGEAARDGQIQSLDVNLHHLVWTSSPPAASDGS